MTIYCGTVADLILVVLLQAMIVPKVILEKTILLHFLQLTIVVLPHMQQSVKNIL